MRSAPPRPWLPVLIVLLALAGAVMAVLAGRLPGAPGADRGEVLPLLLLLGLAGFLGLEFRARGEGNRVDLFDGALAAAIVSLPAPGVVVLVVVAKVLVLNLQRLPPVKTCFNVAQWACAAAAGSLAFAALRAPQEDADVQDLAPLLVALLLVAAVNAGSVLLVLAASTGRPVGTRGFLRGVAVGGVVNLVLGVLCAALWVQAPAARPLVALALLGVHAGTRGWAQHRAGHSRLVGLQRASAALAGPQDLEAAAPRVLTELRRAFACEGAELHLQLDGEEGWTRFTSGADRGAERSAPLVAELLSRGAAVRLSPPDGDRELLVLLSEAGWRDCLAAPVRLDGEVVGLLCTHDREGWEGFEADELGVLEAAAGVLGAAVHRGELEEVLDGERAALQGSEARWRALARILELVARDSPLPETLDTLARTVEEQMGSARAAVVVRAPDHVHPLAAPSLPAPAAAALEELLLPELVGLQRRRSPLVLRLAGGTDGPHRALLHAGVRSVRAWPLPCSADSGTHGALALCYADTARSPQQDALAEGAARVGGLAVDRALVHHRLAHQAAHDVLTDLPNRTVFLDRLGQALRRTERSGTLVLVLFLDLDRFKVVNDSLGHHAGDALLQAVSERLRSAVRPGDTVARFGGDEFTMLCEGIEDEAHAVRVVQRVQESLARPFPLGDSELFATSSIGIALGRGSGTAPETLVEDADAAMYRAKAHGGNCFELFDEELRDRAQHRLATHSALNRAVERDEFRVVYQPTVRLSTGRVEGVEALVRWERPGHGTVQPLHFVPLAEETGLIVPIGAYVLEEACLQARRWRDEAEGEAPLSISVNLSARQLTDPHLVPRVESALEHSGISPSCLSLEITESVLMRDMAASGRVLSDLKSLGVRLFVDDFGTGYSSLTYLQHFPVDGIKVDQSFVAQLGHGSDADAIVGAVIGLAHGLGLVAVAEGVETRDQVEHLIDLDCDIAQGYHFGRPAAAGLLVRG